MVKGKDEGGMMKDEFGYVRVVKKKEVKQFWGYRTRRLVLEAWDAQQG